MMLVTLYTDASWSPHDGTGAYAYFARSSAGRIEHAGRVPRRCPSNHHAEMYAIAKGCADVVMRWPQTRTVFVNTDSMTCLEVLWPWGRSRHQSDSPHAVLGRGLLQWLEGEGVKLRSKHVKAHTGRSDVRSYLNERMDAAARRARTQQP